MVSVVHTCDGCSEVLTVGERYFGRTLRCPKCGRAFVVEAPAEAGATAVEPTGASDGRGRRKWWWLLPSAGIVAVVAWLGLSRDLAGPGFSRQVFQGQVLSVVASADVGRLPAAVEREVAVQLVALGDAAATVVELPPGVIRVAVGTRVVVLEHRQREGVAQVRALDGEWSGRKLWIPSRWLE